MQALSAVSLPTELPAAGAEGTAQIPRALGHLVRASLSRAGDGTILLMSTLLDGKSIPITNWVYFCGEICKIFACLL